MATDGPVTPEQPISSPTSEQKGSLFGRFRKKEAKLAAASQTTPLKETTLNKVQQLMESIKRKDKELDGNVVTEFGQGESQFLALKLGEVNIGEHEGTFDYLLVTPDGPMILRTKAAPLVTAKEFYRNGIPEGVDPDKVMMNDNERTPMLMSSIIYGLTHRDGKDPSYSQKDVKLEESAYSKDNETLSFNFAGKRLVFFESPYAKGTAWLQNTEEVKQSEKTYYGDPKERYNHDARALERLSGDAAKLILEPDPQDVIKVIERNINYAKDEQARKEAERLEAEAKRIAEENTQRAKAQEKTDTIRKQEEERVAKKDQATDAALDILGKL